MVVNNPNPERDFAKDNGHALKVPLTLTQLRVILEALEYSKRMLSPAGGISTRNDVVAYRQSVERVKHAIDIFERRKHGPRS